MKSISNLFFSGIALAEPKDWKQAFEVLDRELFKLKHQKEKIVVFFDELPWLATLKSGFMQQLDHFWNTKWSSYSHLKLILCGSAASWMLDHLINAKGGLHNRITERLPIEPFTLHETALYLKSLGVKWGQRNILEAYMCLGGIPYYLNAIRKGESPTQAISRMCFEKSGLLYDEFDRLFASLFDSSQDHERIVKVLAKSRSGISRNELLKKTHLKSGGGSEKKLRELEAAGFISRFTPYGKICKDAIFRLTDEFSVFHLTWMKKTSKSAILSTASGQWKKISTSPSYRSWCGFAFESVCLKHVGGILRALGLEGTGVNVSSWAYKSKSSSEPGAQIDLLFDRDDGVITLCELKYYNVPFVLEKAYASILQNKIQVFKNVLKIKKDVTICLVCPLPAVQNALYGKCIEHEVNLEALFAS